MSQSKHDDSFSSGKAYKIHNMAHELNFLKEVHLKSSNTKVDLVSDIQESRLQFDKEYGFK